MQTQQPAAYWREQKTWKDWIGKKGVVLVTTQVEVARPEQAFCKPYSYAVINFDGEKREFMGAGNEPLSPGDRVVCVLRKVAKTDNHGLISYGIKVQKLDS